MLGVCPEATYEGQAAIELGAVAVREPDRGYPFALADGQINPGPLLAALLDDLAAGVARDLMAARFLETVVAMLLAGARLAREQTGLQAVCLTGGTFNSRWLVERTAARLEADGFRVYRHRQVPPGDGGLSLGQAMVAQRRWG